MRISVVVGLYRSERLSSSPPDQGGEHDAGKMPDTATWVSGSSETKTYGKDATARAHEEQPTLPRRRVFGKDSDARVRVFNTLYILLFPTEALFSGKLSCTVIAGRYRASS